MRRGFPVIAAVAVLGAIVLLFFVRCERKGGPAAGAEVVVRNESGAGWRISFANTTGGAPVAVRVRAFEEVRVPLPAGRYAVSQTLVDIHGKQLDSRDLSLVLAKGESCEWRLLTLLSNPPEGATR